MWLEWIHDQMSEDIKSETEKITGKKSGEKRFLKT